MIVFWDHVISHANKSSNVAFLKEDRRVSVVATRAKLQLIMCELACLKNTFRQPAWQKGGLGYWIEGAQGEALPLRVS
jgi:hypothetical protein